MPCVLKGQFQYLEFEITAINQTLRWGGLTAGVSAARGRGLEGTGPQRRAQVLRAVLLTVALEHVERDQLHPVPFCPGKLSMCAHNKGSNHYALCGVMDTSSMFTSHGGVE